MYIYQHTCEFCKFIHRVWGCLEQSKLSPLENARVFVHFGDCLGSVVVMLYSGNVKMMHSVLGDVFRDLECVCVGVCFVFTCGSMNVECNDCWCFVCICEGSMYIYIHGQFVSMCVHGFRDLLVSLLECNGCRIWLVGLYAWFQHLWGSLLWTW